MGRLAEAKVQSRPFIPFLIVGFDVFAGMKV